MPQPAEPTRVIAATDGTELALYESGNPAGSTLVCVHGYPDNASVWAGVTALLDDRYRVVSYDVRGAGASGHPTRRDGYRLDQLQDDFVAVLDALNVAGPVHLLAHDWGSIQAWRWVSDPTLAARLASFTSISGPSLDDAGRWLRRNLRSPRTAPATLRQLARSYYIAAFQLPVLPELLWRSGLLSRAIGTPATGYRRRPRDRISGLELYRANFPVRPAAQERDRIRRCAVPVQVLAPAGDSFVTPALQLQAPRELVTRLYPRPIAGRHWVVADRPDVIAAATRELVRAVETGIESPALERARVGCTRRGPFAGRLVLVTGSGSGIGRDIAFAFARAGADLLLADVNASAANETCEQARRLGTAATGCRLDVADPGAWRATVAQIERDHGLPDVLVNNAWIERPGPPSSSAADLDRLIATNLHGVLTGSRLIGERMGVRGHGGRIVNIAPSATTEAAVLTLSARLRDEFATAPVSVTAICLGSLDPHTGRTARVEVGPQARSARQAIRSHYQRDYSPNRVGAEIVRAVAAGTPVKHLAPGARRLLAFDRHLPWSGGGSPRSGGDSG